MQKISKKLETYQKKVTCPSLSLDDTDFKKIEKDKKDLKSRCHTKRKIGGSGH